MTDSPNKIEADVEANRANVESTLDALKSRLSVENIVNDATRFVGINDARGTLVAVGREIKAEPVAFGLIGLGLTLLATGIARRDPGNQRAGYPQAGHGPSQGRPYQGYDSMTPGAIGSADHKGLSTRAHEYTDQARKAAAAYSAKAGAKASEYTDAANRHLHDAQHAVHDGYDYTLRHASDLQRRAGQQMESQPLLFGALALAAGAVIAAALPRSNVEDRWVGPTRDRLLDEAKDVAADLGDRATSAAQAGYAAAVETAKDEGLVHQGGDTLASKIENVAQAAVAGAKAKDEENHS